MHKRVGSSTVCTVRGLASLWLAGMCLLSCDWLVWSSLNMLRTSSWHEFLFVWAASSPECWLLLSSVFNVRTSNLHWSMSLSSLKGCYYSVVRSDKLSRSVCESDDLMLLSTWNLHWYHQWPDKQGWLGVKVRITNTPSLSTFTFTYSQVTKLGPSDLSLSL